MSLISLKQLLDHASEYNYAVPAFNVNNLEQIQAVVESAHDVNSPVIIQVSSSALKYAGSDCITSIIFSVIKKYNHIPICLHLDHGISFEMCVKAIELGFSSVMIDGSLLSDGKTPSNYNYNVDITHKVVQFAHIKGVSVEGELGCLGSLETGYSAEEDGIGSNIKLTKNKLLTNVDDVLDFVKKTKVDALAIAIGTSHGAYKFSKYPTDDILSLSQLKKINLNVPSLPLVLHGASSVPSKLLEIINLNGGKIGKAFGVPVKEIKECINYGIRKVNIDTDLRLAFTAAVRQYLTLYPSEFDPRKYNLYAKKYMIDICKDKFKEFNSIDKASKIKVKSFNEMKKKYYNN